MPLPALLASRAPKQRDRAPVSITSSSTSVSSSTAAVLGSERAPRLKSLKSVEASVTSRKLRKIDRDDFDKSSDTLVSEASSSVHPDEEAQEEQLVRHDTKSPFCLINSLLFAWNLS
jgi:hypothetical protein